MSEISNAPVPAGLARKQRKPEPVTFLLTRDDILSRPAVPAEVIHVPEWDRDGQRAMVRVQGLTARQRDAYYASMAETRGGRQVGVNTDNATAKLCMLCIVDEEGKPLFSAADLGPLGELPSAALSAIAEVCQRLSGMSDRAVEDAGKGSAVILSAGSTSD